MVVSKPLLPLFLAWTSTSLPCVSAADLVPLVVSVSVCVVMLFVVIIMLVLGYIWPDLRKNWVQRNRKVKMPKAYFRKKEEVKRRLINGSIASCSPSTNNPHLHTKTTDTASWVQGWHQENPVPKAVYEEQGVTMELGDENEQEFRIETVVVDNEVLDVGPYKSTQLTSAQPSAGSIYSEPYIYTTGDRAATVTKSSKETGGMVSSVSQMDIYVPDGEMNEVAEAGSQAKNKAATGFEEQLVKL